jgi:preprotein translocase subunit SecF
MRNTRLE